MKKFVVFVLLGLMLTGCGKNANSNIKDSFVSKIEKKSSYLMKGTMSISSNEDVFSYNVVAAKNKEDYRVNLVNQINNHEQVILKSGDDVYVVTPSLNKSFKFQSEWPDNGSQGYLIDSLVNDIKNDADSKGEACDDGYIITSKVNYPNNANLVSEKIYLNKDEDVTKVEILDAEGNVKITVNYSSIDFKPTFKSDYFKLESLIDNNVPLEEETSKTIDDIVYPLYLPKNTYLNSKDVVSTDDGNRVILTFTGDSPFTLVEEVSRASDEFEIIPVFGEPLLLSQTMGALSSNSLYWTSNKIDFYISSNKLNGTELLTIAESVSSGALSVAKEK